MCEIATQRLMGILFLYSIGLWGVWVQQTPPLTPAVPFHLQMACPVPLLTFLCPFTHLGGMFATALRFIPSQALDSVAEPLLAKRWVHFYSPSVRPAWDVLHPQNAVQVMTVASEPPNLEWLCISYSSPFYAASALRSPD